MSKTQIVATIGPASNSPEVLRQLWQAGMSVARLNGSHNDLSWHAATIATIRRTLPDVPILLDIPGRKIRTTQLATEPRFQAGQTIVLTTDLSYTRDDKVPVNYANLHEDLSPGDAVLADDGTLRFTVTQVSGRDIVVRAECNGQLKSRKRHQRAVRAAAHPAGHLPRPRHGRLRLAARRRLPRDQLRRIG